jgi:hypothetical protein
MKWKELEEEPCSMARTIGVIGDRWTLLILRECFLRTRRFEGFSVRARNYTPLTRRAAEKAGPAGRAAAHSVSGFAETPRVYSNTKRTRPLSDHDGDRALGRYPHGRRTRPAVAA